MASKTVLADRRAMSGVREALGAGEPHPATGRTDDQHVADVAADRRGQPEIGQHLKTAGADHVATCLVSGEGRFVDQGHSAPPRASTRAATLPAGPPPTTRTSKRDMPTLLLPRCSDLQ